MIIFKIIILYNFFYIIIKGLIYWGLGIGDWGLGIGDWAQSPIPNPQSPIPNNNNNDNEAQSIIYLVDDLEITKEKTKAIKILNANNKYY